MVIKKVERNTLNVLLPPRRRRRDRRRNEHRRDVAPESAAGLRIGIRTTITITRGTNTEEVGQTFIYSYFSLWLSIYQPVSEFSALNFYTIKCDFTYFIAACTAE